MEEAIKRALRRKAKKIKRSCTSKKFFESDVLAYREVQKGTRQGYLKPLAWYYKCPYCVGYHITNNRCGIIKIRIAPI